MKLLIRSFGLMAIFCCSIQAQQDSIQKLDEVVLKKTIFKDSSYTKTYSILSDSLIERNQASLTNLLNFNSTIYFKENGAGMVSSPSFRGTTASQTAVLWNGININSQTTGQTDFNTVVTRGFDQIIIQPGGGGVDVGSNAIGGTIALENRIEYNTGLQNQFLLTGGSFNTYGLNYDGQYSNQSSFLGIQLSHNASDNDYPFLESDRINENGQYQNSNLGLNAGFKLSSYDELRVYFNVFDGKRHFSLPTPNALPTKYYDFNTRSLVEWISDKDGLQNNIKAAYLTENYEFYPNIERDVFSFGEVRSFILKHSTLYEVSSSISLIGRLNYIRNDGTGSDIESETRNLGSAVVGLKHQLSDDVIYEVNLRQELNQDFENPFLYSFGIQASLSDFYAIKANTSKSFRIPTFNDLYWQGLGNSELLPELSYQGELSHVFTWSKQRIQLTTYYNQVENLLNWVPDISGIWRPQNTDEVEIYGLEVLTHLEKQWGDHEITFDQTYAYTVSENKATGNQLIYVPYHKVTAALSYNLRRFSAFYQQLYNGQVFTTTDNAQEQILGDFSVANIGLEYDLGKTQNYEVGVQLLNLWNVAYQSVQNRPMPGRNINAYVNLTF
ncbi:TonB-dependent receptor plug domain-containing protein [Psychroflexus tropicus]|uniref:TonB-dependent receptor plug domain-containing protein n=1 Tax=Psychroflexus tropicus TaxID=197345 RepID=UPI000382731D|nr:TonB-dependent receptor [Psychroflexus tropicus]